MSNKGRKTIAVTEDLHKEIRIVAASEGKSILAVIRESFELYKKKLKKGK